MELKKKIAQILKVSPFCIFFSVIAHLVFFNGVQKKDRGIQKC